MTPRLAAVLALPLAFAPAAAAADVVVGVAGPMSGAFAPVGAEMAAGVTAAAERLNAAGGIDGEPVVVEVADDKCDAATGAAVANQLVGRGAVLVVGHACTAAAIPAAEVYAANGIVLVSPAATNPRLTDERIGSGIFRLAPRSDDQPRVLGRWMGEAFAGKRAAFVHDGGVYGQGLADATREAFVAAGGTAVLTESFTPGEQSQNALVGIVQDAFVQAVMIGGLHADAAVIATQLRERGLEIAIVGGEALGVDEFRDLAGPAADGVVFTLPDDPRLMASAAGAVADIEAAGAEPTGAAVAAHAALEIYAAARRSAADGSFDAVVAEIRSGEFDTALGEVSFDDKGDARRPGWDVYVWRDGAPAPLR